LTDDVIAAATLSCSDGGATISSAQRSWIK
jgi:hypothetical protein